jgi:Fe-S cluster assembly scaffold protein SufB
MSATKTIMVKPGKTKQFVLSEAKNNDRYELTVKPAGDLTFIITKLPSQLELSASLAKDAHLTIILAVKVKTAASFLSHVKLIGSGARVTIQLALVSSGQAETKLNTTLEHLAPDTTGRIISRRVLTDGSNGGFIGMLKVGAAATQTDTYLSDKVLLVGDKSSGTSVPNLEILTNNVKASHGTAIGKLSADELFYLQSRGIKRSQAEKILHQAWLQPALAGLPADLKDSFTR